MACRTLYISQQDFKDRVDLSENVISKYIVPHIGLVQDKYISNIICEVFNSELITQIENSTLTSANSTLVNDYIKPAMVYRSYARYVSRANVYSTPSGFRKFRDDNSDAASSEELRSIIDIAESDAAFYERKLYDYLQNNLELYPTYRDNCSCVSSSTLAGIKISKVSSKKRKLYIDGEGSPECC